jgi:putative flippase GtrA
MAKAMAGAGDVIANVTGYGVGLVLSFWLNRTWTFGHRGDRWSAMGRFLLVFAVAYVLNLAVVLLLVRSLQLNSYLSQILGVVPYTLFSYFATRHVVFRD